MGQTATGDKTNRSFCEHCGEIVPVRHEARENNRMYLVKDCPNCGTVETCVSNDAKGYLGKREMCGYEGEAQETCNLKCIGCDHGFSPKLVHVDVTNRCNMKCPICCANVEGMGFEFNPPIEYFEKIFKKLATHDPKPRVQFFGGEPTARNDLIEIIELARSYGLPSRVVTNGIRLANKDYCKKLLDTRANLLFGFDGCEPEIYDSMRKDARVLDLKIKALDNIKELSTRRITILCTTGRGINDKHMAGFLQMCHDRREQIAVVALIPLQVTPGPTQIGEESTSIEEAEEIIAEAMPGAKFVPAYMLQQFETAQEVFGFRVTLGGSHPNCESVTLLIGDEERYYPVDEWLTRPFRQVVQEAIAWDRAMGERLKTSVAAKIFGKKFVVGASLLRFAWGALRVRKFIGKNPIRNYSTMIWRKITTGKQWKRLIRRHSGVRGILRLIVLPYEDKGWLESARLASCPVAFAYEDPKTEDISLIPFCSYFVYKNEILKATSDKYGIASNSAKDKVEAESDVQVD